MNRRGHKGRTDGNHTEILKALRDSGIQAQSIASVGDGCPDIIAGFRGMNFLLEVKDGDKPLTKAEINWHATWPGQVMVVRSGEEAITAVVRFAREAGRI